MISTTTRAIAPRAISFSDGAIETLRDRLAGEVLTVASPGYDAARIATFLSTGHHPLAIVRPAGDADVAATVSFARELGLPLAVRSGGHSIALLSMVDGAVVVDFSAMKRVDIEPETRIARVQPGATSAELAGPAHEHGLALSTGDTPSVGMGGLTTGGGIGFMVRKYGLAIDNLLEARVVTAAGEIVTASETSHPDLFWAIRGGGGNAGIVTELTFRLAPVGEVLGGMLVLPATREVIRGYLDYASDASEDLTTIADLMPAPPAPFIPPELVGTPVVHVLAVWTGGVEDGQAALAPLRALADPIADLLGPMPYPAIYDFTRMEQDVDRAAVVRMMFADELSDAAVDAVLAAVEDTGDAISIVQLRGLGGAMARVAPDATAFAHRERRLFVALIRVWYDLAEDTEPHEAWIRSLWEAIRGEGSGVYVNFLQNEGEDRVREAYPGGTFERLAGIKRRYDPENHFRFNQNVPPKD